jgi:ubiquinone/menaquinone biosynthesis C-methylase UbiE
MAFADPQKIVAQLGLVPGDRVADLGAGNGEFTFASSRIVGNAGRVFAIEVQKDLVTRVKNAARGMDLPHNIEVIWGDVEEIGGTSLRDASVNAVIASNILFQLDEKDNFATEINRIMKPNGRLLVIDWSESYGNMGPRREMVVTRESAEKLLEKHGFALERAIDAGDHHWGVCFHKRA